MESFLLSEKNDRSCTLILQANFYSVGEAMWVLHSLSCGIKIVVLESQCGIRTVKLRFGSFGVEVKV